MSGNLVIVESPEKARTIQKFLGDGYSVMASKGHIRDLQEKSLSIDIEHNFMPEYVVSPEKKKTVADLSKAAKAADVIYLASDEDREGEAISWHLSETLGLDPSKTKRIAFHEITRTAIEEAVKNPRSIDMNMVNAQQARRVLDRLVGFELSPLLWRKIKRGLSAGRVQSVALRLVVDREREIQAFQSEASYRVEAVFKINGQNVKGVLDRRFEGKAEAGQFLSDMTGASFTVAGVEKKEGTRTPAAPFTTSTLQQEAGRKLHMPVSITMRVAQSLYERGLITYMRTDSTNLSSLALAVSKKFITENFGEEYSRTRQYKTKSKGAQEAHEAIRPTFIENTTIDGSPQEKKLYELIWKRTVASQMADARILATTVKVASDKRSETFSIQASEVLFDGFLKLYIESDDEDTDDETVILPNIEKGQKVDVNGIDALCKYSQPPYRYSEPSLVKKLEELGIGRPSTYATIISTLTSGRGYIVKGDKEGQKMQVTNLSLKNGVIRESSKTETIGAEKGKLLPQDIGMVVTDYLVDKFSSVLDYDFTANVEKDFDRIAEGKLVWNKMISDFYSPFHRNVDITKNDGQYAHVSRELGIDPSDGRMVTARLGQYGPYVQKGEGEDKVFASLSKGQLIESITLEEALGLFILPRTVGEIEGVPVVAMKGKFGPYLKYGARNVSLPRGTDPVSVSLEECRGLIEAAQSKVAQNEVMKEYEASDIQIINGRYGPYIKHSGANYKIPKDKSAETLTEEECLEIIASGPAPASKKFRRFRAKAGSVKQ